jgi:hypothetical protein
MADEPKPDSKIISALGDLYVSCLTCAEQIRRLKVHFKVKYRYCRLVEMLHCMLMCECCHNTRHNGKTSGHCVMCWSFCVLHRIEGLGGEVESEIEPIVLTDDVKAALEKILVRLQDVYGFAQVVIAAAKDDHPTAKIAGEIQCAAECHIECVKAHLRQIEDLKESYLITLV